MRKQTLPSIMTAWAIAALPLHTWADATNGPAVERPIAATVMTLAKRCAPKVHPLTMAYLVAQESSNRRFAININGEAQLPAQPQTEAEAREIVKRLDSEGVNYDLGLAQINSGNFEWLDVSGVDLLDGCTNLKASEKVLVECYQRASRIAGNPQQALRHALSCYNTGSMTRGFDNGYVASVEKIAGIQQVPRLLPEDRAETDSTSKKPAVPEQSGMADAFSQAGEDAFGNADSGAFGQRQVSTHQSES